MDLIEGRDIETVSQWLKKFPNIKMLSRDGSTSYKSAIEKANSNIKQVSDRFHTIKGLSEVLSKYIRKKYSKNIILIQSEENAVTNNSFDDEYDLLTPNAKENYDRKNQEFNQIKEYYNKCNNYSKTAKKFNVDPRTVKEYVHMEKLPISKRSSKSTLDKFKDVIIDNIDKKLEDIYKILKNKGYKGTYSNVRAYISRKNLKVSVLDKNIYVNRTNIIEILYHKGIEDLKINSLEKQHLKLLLKKEKELAEIIKINDNFSIALFSGDTDKMNKWIEEAKKLNIAELDTFISSIESDIEAVNNSISNIDISNGLIEGKNCKMKLIKRIMFGRCSSKLMRAKLLQLG